MIPITIGPEDIANQCEQAGHVQELVRGFPRGLACTPHPGKNA